MDCALVHSPVIAVCKSLFAVFAFHGIGIAPDADLSLILVIYHQQFTRPLHDLAAKELEAIRVIECLKKSGMEIKDIKQFMEWCTEGSKTYPKRLDLFVRQKAAVEMEIERLNRVLDMLKFKCWYYEEAIKDGTEDRITAMSPEEMPEEIRQAFLNAHR